MNVIVLVNAQNYDNEFYSFYQNIQIDTCSALKINREIIGGTKIIVTFDGHWDEDMKGAFRYACKIWEENLPTMLPITINASIGTFRGSNSNALSKVLTNRLSNDEFGIAPQARYLILQDYNKRHRIHFMNLQDSLDLCGPDISITYNNKMLNPDSLSFSLDTCSTTKIDFVTQVLRDIAVGLGFSTHFVPYNNQLEFPAEMGYTGLEILLTQTITTNDPYEAYNQATQGCLPIYIPFYGTLYLYAPSTWQQNISLNTFLPQSNSCISQLLTWKFGKGTIIRDIADDYDNIFYYGFLWQSDLPDGGPKNVDYYPCNNDEAVNYHGTITELPPLNLRSAYSIDEATEKDSFNSFPLNNRDYVDTFDYESYCKPYDPTLSMADTVNFEGWTFSILKNDGTWDVVTQNIVPNSIFEINLSNITFHYPDTAYARTTDNFLRGRVSHNIRESYSDQMYNSIRTTYYVLEYLPQKIEQNLAKVYDESYLQDEYLRDIEIAMSNLEGATQIYVEQLEEGDYYPSITLLPNIKQGRFLATVDKEYSSEFTIVSYNNNGFKRSNALTVDALEPANLNINVENGRICVTYGHKNKQVEDCTYSIIPISKSLSKGTALSSGKCQNGEIPSSALTDGMNIIKVVHPNGKHTSIKILKKNINSNNKSTFEVVI